MARKKKDEDLITKIDDMIAEGNSFCPAIHSRVRENQRYERGLQWSKGDMEKMVERDTPIIPNNSLIKVINAIANKEIIDRFESRVFGRSDFDNGVATVLDKANRWQRDMAETEHYESLAFRSSVGSGIGVMHKWFDGNMWEGEGKIVDEEVPVWSMLWPVKSRETNLSDRRWHIYGKIMAISEAEYMFGDISRKTKQTFAKINREKDIFGRDAAYKGYEKKHATATLSWDSARKGIWYSVAEDEVWVVEAEWKETRIVWRAAVPTRFEEVWSLYTGEAPSIPYQVEGEDGQPQESELAQEQVFGDMAEEGKLQELLYESEIYIFEDKEEFDMFRERYEELTGETFVDFSRPSKEIVKYAIRVDDVIVDSGERPYGFTFEFLTGWRNEGEDYTDWFGAIDVAKGPQDFKNAMLGSLLKQYMVSPKGGLMMDNNIIDNPTQFANEYAKGDAILWVKPGVSAGKDTTWRELPKPTFPPMNERLLDIAYSSIEELFGLSSIDMGNQGDLRRVSGNVVQAAKVAGNTIMAMFFDSLRKYRKRFGALNLRFLSEHYTPTQLLRIIGEENAPEIENLPDTWDNILKYDVKVEESPVSASEKMERLEKLQQVGSPDKWLDAGHITFPMMIEELVPGISESFKRKVSEFAAENNQKDQEISSLQNQMQELQAYQTALMEFMKQRDPQGVQMFDQLASMAEPMARQMQQEYQSAQEEQAPEEG